MGLANATWTAGFRFLPGVYDLLVGPGMSRLGLSTVRTQAHEGNVFAATPAGEAVHGRWGRHWLRGFAALGVPAAVLVLAHRRGISGDPTGRRAGSTSAGTAAPRSS